MSQTKNAIPVIDGLYTGPSDAPQLIGGKCKTCKTVFFPITPQTHAPDCANPECEKILLGRRGRIVSYTIHYYQPPPPFRMDPFEPFAIAAVELPEKIQVVGMLIGVPFDEIKVGSEVEMVSRRLYDDDDGNEVHTWMWKVVK